MAVLDEHDIYKPGRLVEYESANHQRHIVYFLDYLDPELPLVKPLSRMQSFFVLSSLALELLHQSVNLSLMMISVSS